jgi:hypothetical protein
MNAGPLSRRGQWALDPLVQCPNHARRRQVGVNLDPQRLAVKIVVDVEGAQAPPGPQRIGHALEPGQLGFDVLQVPQLRHLHADVLVPPDVVGRLADAVLAARLGDLRAGLDLLKDQNGSVPR